jgi:hypothetical protein
MSLPARNQNVIVTITRPTRGYGNTHESLTTLVSDARGFRHPGGVLSRGGGGTILRRSTSGATEEQPDHVIILDPWETPGLVRTGDQVTWRRLDTITRRPIGGSFTGTILRISERDSFARGRFAHVELAVRGGDGTGI